MIIHPANNLKVFDHLIIKIDMNTRMLDILQGDESLYPHELEKNYLRVMNKIIDAWYTPQAGKCFFDLIVDKRGGARQGFPKKVAVEIFRLSQFHERTCTVSQDKIENPWAAIDDPELQNRDLQVPESKSFIYSPQEFFKLIETGSSTSVSEFLSHGFDLNVLDEHEWPPLMISSFNGNEDITRLLIQNHADIQFKDKAGYTPLHLAAFNGHTSVVKLLLENNSDPNASCNFGWTPLIQAATRGHIDSINLLIASGANVNLASKDGWTALHKATANEHAEVVKLLLSHLADSEMRLEDGSTALSIAIKHKNEAIITIINQHNKMRQTTRTGNESGQIDLRKAVQNLDALPAMPVIAQKLLALRLDTEEGERMLLVLIEQDPQISAKILGLANSAQIGVSRHVRTMKDAVMLLGLKRVQSVSTGIAIMSLMSKPPSGKFNMQDLWLHSFSVAFAMLGLVRFMPAKTRPQDDQLFLAGMLHDIGYLALAFLSPTLSNKLHTRLAAETGRPSLEVEREILDMCHDELGAELGRHWNLPEEIIAVLRYHHHPEAIEAEAGQPLVRMINIVLKLLPTIGFIEHGSSDISTEEWESLGIDPSKAEEVKEQVDEQAEQAIQFVSSFA